MSSPPQAEIIVTGSLFMATSVRICSAHFGARNAPMPKTKGRKPEAASPAATDTELASAIPVSM